MTRLVAPDVDEFRLFEEVVEAKRGVRRARLRNISRLIGARYAEYADNIAHFSRLATSTLSTLRSRDCIHCYTSATSALGDIKNAVVKAMPQNRSFYCQYCLISEWDGLDHYAPKERFPEFSVLARNLVPCCPKCNRLKGDDWPVTGPSVLNLYYDHLPNQGYLAVNIDFDAAGIPVVSFSIQQVDGISSSTIRRIREHFTKLELLSRYNDAGVDAVLSYKQTCLMHDFANPSDLVQHLNDEAAGLAAQHGANYWKAVVVEELADSIAFINQIMD